MAAAIKSTIDGKLTHGISVAGSSVHFSDAVKLLGVTLEQTLSFDQHVPMLSARVRTTPGRRGTSDR